MGTAKEPIRLRQRKTQSGLVSLYLDIYIHGNRSYEYLRLYLVPEKTRADKEKNRTTLALAEDIRAKRMVELRNGEFGFKSAYNEDTLFYPYFEAMCKERHTRNGWYACLYHMQEYDKRPNLRFRDITHAWVVGFRNYLEKDAKAFIHDKRKRDVLRSLSSNSKWMYFNNLRSCLKKAFEEHVISSNPMRGICNFKFEESQRMYLTVEELRRLAATEYESQALKNAFLFSCLTGLRRSDIEKLTWGEVKKQGDYTRIIFKQKKTRGQEYLDISPQAVELMGERKMPGDKVFDSFFTTTITNYRLREWARMAGIDKHITFHSGRHTFAVMMLDIGTDIYTVSKLLGHREIRTTQIYAKVLDKNKQAAVAMIPPIIEGSVK